MIVKLIMFCTKILLDFFRAQY